MILGIGKELSAFIMAMLAGNMVYLTYLVIRVFRRILRHNLFWVSLEDALFWIATGFYLFSKIYQTSNGTIRWYFVLGVLAGGIFTHLIVSKFVKKHIENFNEKE